MSAAIRSERITNTSPNPVKLPDFAADQRKDEPGFDLLLAAEVDEAEIQKEDRAKDTAKPDDATQEKDPLIVPFLIAVAPAPMPSVPDASVALCPKISGDPVPNLPGPSLEGAASEPPKGTAEANAPPEPPPSGPSLISPSKSEIVAGTKVPAMQQPLPADGSKPTDKTAGMAAAQGGQMLFRSLKPNEVAASIEQKLPPGASSLAGARLLDVDFAPAIEQQIPLTTASVEKFTRASEPPVVFAQTVPAAADPLVFDSDLVVVPSPIPRAVELITEQVRLLSAEGASSIEAVLTPDAQTELLLQVTQVDGEIVVRARIERGDFSAFQAHWPLIQQELSMQGIRVESLENMTAHNGNRQGDTHPGGERPNGATEHFNGETRANGSKEKGPARPSRFDEQGWQRWA